MSPTPQAPAARRGPVSWPSGPVVAITLGLVVLALPARLEGPPLVAISPGHALSLVDSLGVLPLAAGALWLQVGLWRRRARLATWAADHPGAAGRLGFAAGLGLGLLLASAFSRFFWWWALGAVILLAATGVALAIATRGRPAEGNDAPAPVAGA